MEQHETSPRRTDELNRRYILQRRIGVGGSVLVHLLVFALFSRAGMPPVPTAAAGPRAGDDAAAAGGGMQLVSPPATERAEDRIVRPPVPVPAPEVVVEDFEESSPTVEPVEFDQVPALAVGPDGPDSGPGLENGEGAGDGGDAAEGRTHNVPPVPRGMIMPPSDRPDEVRGKEIEVWVFVTAAGRVVPDSTRLVPSSGKRDFDERLKERAAAWDFEPAMRRGEPVASWFRYVITL